VSDALGRKVLTVIVPARDEEQNVPYFYERASRVLNTFTDLDCRIVFINNASTDGTFDQVGLLRATDPRVKIITLSRDFGYHAALVAGLSSVESDYYALIDVDCEDPPELLGEFYLAIQGGAQLAYGIRSKRQEPGIITLGRRLFYIANRRVADSEIVMWMGEFSMFTRQVRDAILAPRTTFMSVRAELGYVGFRRVGIEYLREQRKYGQTHYNLWRMTVYALLSILSGTTFPLRLVMYLAVLVAIAFPLYTLTAGLSAAEASVTASIFMLYFVVVSLPMISLYLARVYKNVVRRPIYIIDQTRTHL
jgi:dolichol-phosphate mannosyltransferase